MKVEYAQAKIVCLHNSIVFAIGLKDGLHYPEITDDCSDVILNDEKKHNYHHDEYLEAKEVVKNDRRDYTTAVSSSFMLRMPPTLFDAGFFTELKKIVDNYPDEEGFRLARYSTRKNAVEGYTLTVHIVGTKGASIEDMIDFMKRMEYMAAMGKPV